MVSKAEIEVMEMLDEASQKLAVMPNMLDVQVLVLKAIVKMGDIVNPKPVSNKDSKKEKQV
jgi:hypothetical protein